MILIITMIIKYTIEKVRENAEILLIFYNGQLTKYYI